jgi:hypothetical protein
MIPRPRLTPPPASSASHTISTVLELDPGGRTRTTNVVAAPKIMAFYGSPKIRGERKGSVPVVWITVWDEVEGPGPLHNLIWKRY